MRTSFLALLLIAGAGAAAQVGSAPDTPRLQARVLGDGPPVVLLGGGLLGADSWGAVPEGLAATHRVISAQSLSVQYGLEGRALPPGYSPRTEAAALAATLDALHLDAVDLVGMSHGGVTALIFALDQPRRVRTLTLIEPPAFWLLPNQGRDDPAARDMQDFLETLRDAEITEADVERFRCLLGDCRGGRSPRTLPQWTQWVKYRHSLRALHTVGAFRDDPARLRRVTAPALIVHGAGTVAFHRTINAALVRLLPKAEALELPGGHNSPASSPGDFVKAWEQFVERAHAAAARQWATSDRPGWRGPRDRPAGTFSGA